MDGGVPTDVRDYGRSSDPLTESMETEEKLTNDMLLLQPVANSKKTHVLIKSI